jgi:hypothetical protein
MPVCADFEGGKCAVSFDELCVTFCRDDASNACGTPLAGLDARPAEPLDLAAVVKTQGEQR